MTQKKNFVGELELLAVIWGIERFRFHQYGKKVQLFSDHQALEPLLKKNKTNKQYSARLTRWLDRLNHFDITLKYTAGKEIKFTNFISRNPTENADPEEKYEEEFVINAIAQLATVNEPIGRSFNQSENSNTTKTDNMHDTRNWYEPLQNKQRPFKFNTDRIPDNYGQKRTIDRSTTNRQFRKENNGR